MMKKTFFIVFLFCLLIGASQAALVEYPYGTITDSLHYTTDTGDKAFDHIDSTRWNAYPATFSYNSSGAWVKVDYGAGVTHKITDYSMMLHAGTSLSPKTWTLEASNDDSTYTIIDFQTGITSWTDDVYKNFTTSATMAYRYYKIYITESNTAGDLLIYEANFFLNAGAPTASFTKNQMECVEPCEVGFTDTSTETPTTWVWNSTNVVGNNTATTFATVQNPSFVFNIGNHTIQLNATNPYGSNVSTQVSWVNVSSGVQIPIVQWITDKLTVVFPGKIMMNDTSVRDGVHDPTSWNYTTGDGKTNVSLDQRNVSYQYVKRGVWNASLSVSNSAGTNTSYKLIRVIGYAGLTPTVNDKCVYSVSRNLDVLEKMRVECQLCGKC
jgi:PKD repeat protein